VDGVRERRCRKGKGREGSMSGVVKRKERWLSDEEEVAITIVKASIVLPIVLLLTIS
jgi:hypothetical protein